MLQHRLASLLLLLAACSSGGVARAVLIDFESIPSGTPVDGMAVTDQFQAAYGVRFSLENGGDPLLARVGVAMTAFGGPPNNEPDTPAAAQAVGNFFLTDDGAIEAPPSPLLISFDDPVARASVRVIDIDGWAGGSIWEGFVVEARDGLGAVLETRALRYPDPGTGDGIASLFAFDRGAPEIHSLRISYDPGSTKTWGIGFAVDDLWFVVPEPGTGVLLALALAALGAPRHSPLQRERARRRAQSRHNP